MQVSLPCVGQKRSGVLPLTQDYPTFNCSLSSQSANIGPDAGDPRGSQCKNGVGYLQGFVNVPGYSSGTTVYTFYNASPYSSSYWDKQGHDNTYVQYWWCPTNSDPVNGINWAYGRSYPDSGYCINITVGAAINVGVYGAGMFTQGATITDGESLTTYNNICSGNYVWDYSNAEGGSVKYKPWMDTPNGGWGKRREFVHGTITRRYRKECDWDYCLIDDNQSNNPFLLIR